MNETQEPEVDETPMSEAENFLAKISNAELQCRSRESEVEAIKDNLKAARQAYDDSVAKLRRLCSEAGGESLPLFDDPNEPVADDGWKEVAIEELWATDPIDGFGAKKREAVVDAVVNLGGLEKLRAAVGTDADHLSKLLPAGIGEKLADEIEERHLNFVASWLPQEPQEVKSLVDFAKTITPEMIAEANREGVDFQEGWQDFLSVHSLEKLDHELTGDEGEQVMADTKASLAAAMAAELEQKEAEGSGSADVLEL